MPVQIVHKVCDGTGFLHIAVFHKSGSSPLDSFDILTVFWSMSVPHATGVFQTRTNEGEIGLTFNTFWTGIKIACDETKGPVSLPYKISLYESSNSNWRTIQLPSKDGEIQIPSSREIENDVLRLVL